MRALNFRNPFPTGFIVSAAAATALVMSSESLGAATFRVANQGGGWSNADTWEPEGVPTAGDVAMLVNDDVIETGSNAFLARLVVAEGSSLQVDDDVSGDDIHLNGGRIFMTSNVSTYRLSGSIRVSGTSFFRVGRNRQRELDLTGVISGNGTIVMEDFDPSDADATGLLELTGPDSPFSGDWIVQNGILEAITDRCLGSGMIEVQGGKRATLRLRGGGTVTESNTIRLEGSGTTAGKADLQADVRVGALIINGETMPIGVYHAGTHPDHLTGPGSIAVGAAGLRAFPTAEGFGLNSVGGRGGTVYRVTNLNDSGSGSLREAIDASGPRTVVFEVSGTIALQTDLVVRNSFLTIAGQTAPGDGICLKDRSFVINADHVIVRYLRSRVGDTENEDLDAIWIRDSDHVMIDHCSASWGVDENLSVSRNSDHITVQWSIISEGLRDSVHSEGLHGLGSLIRGQRGARYSFHHNLWAHNHGRNPRPGGNLDIDEDPVGLLCDFRNNVIYNWGEEFAGSNLDEDRITKYNFVNNYYRAGPDTDSDIVFIPKPPFIEERQYAFREDCPVAKAHFSGNLMNGDQPDSPWDLVDGETGGSYRVASAFDTSEGAVLTSPAITALDQVLNHAGASLVRDSADARVVQSVRDGNGGIINDESDVGGWPSLGSLSAPLDSDGDGMPDDWETTNGHDPNNASDGAQDSNGDGYTNLEEYLNSLARGTGYLFTASSGLGGSVTLPPDQTAAAGTTAYVFINPEPWFSIEALLVDGIQVPATTILEFPAVDRSHDISATFSADLTSNQATPLWWLADNGLFDFEADVLADQDEDGLFTWQEYRLATDPRDSNSVPRAVGGISTVGEQQFLTITYRRPSGGLLSTDSVEFSANLRSWQAGESVVTPVGSPIDHGDGTETVTFRSTTAASGDEKQFLRVKFSFP